MVFQTISGFEKSQNQKKAMLTVFYSKCVFRDIIPRDVFWIAVDKVINKNLEINKNLAEQIREYIQKSIIKR